MEPVRVVCSSCNGKLVVRLESLLGQTVICPRCKSSVQIPKSPQGKSIIAPTSYDSSAITRVDDGQLAQQLIDEQVKPGGLFELDGQSFESAIDAFRPVDEGFAGTQPNVAKASSSSVDEDVPMVPLIHDHAITESRMADWNHPETKRRRQLLMIAMAAIAATLVATGGLIAFLSFQSSKDIISQAPLSPEISEPDKVPVEAVPQAKMANPEADATVIKSNSSIDLQPNKTSVAEPPVANPVELPAAKASALPENLASNLQANSFEKMFPTKSPDGTSTKDTNPSNPNSPSMESFEVPDAMKRLSQVFDPGSLTLMPDAITNETPNNISEGGPEKVDVETLYHPAPVNAPSWIEIQSTRIQRLATKNSIPLNSLLVFLGQLSGGGFSWDVESVRMSGYNTDESILLSVEAITIGEFFKSFCSEHEIVATIEEQGSPRLRPIPETILQRLPTDWSIDDLAANEASISEWQELLKQLYGSWNNEWELRGTTLYWSETASLVHKATLAAFLDQARIALGLMQKSTLPESVTDPKLGLEESVKRLSRPGTRIIEHPMSWPQLLDISARESGLKLIFDWDALFSHGFSHSKAATSLLRWRSWPEIAKWGLDEFSLVAVVDGVDQVVLTILPQQRRVWRTIILKQEPGKTIESVRESLRMLSPTDDQGRSMLVVRPLPSAGESQGSWVVARICPPNTFQLQMRVLRDALKLPPLMKNP